MYLSNPRDAQRGYEEEEGISSLRKALLLLMTLLMTFS